MTANSNTDQSDERFCLHLFYFPAIATSYKTGTRLRTGVGRGNPETLKRERESERTAVVQCMGEG